HGIVDRAMHSWSPPSGANPISSSYVTRPSEGDDGAGFGQLFGELKLSNAFCTTDACSKAEVQKSSTRSLCADTAAESIVSASVRSVSRRVSSVQDRNAPTAADRSSATAARS